MPYYLVVLKGGRAEIVKVPPEENPNQIATDHIVLDSYTVRAEAQERCDVENDPERRGLLVLGKLKIRKTG